MFLFSELAEPVEIAALLSTLYLEDNDADVPKPDDAAKRKEDRRRLGAVHKGTILFFIHLSKHCGALQPIIFCCVFQSFHKNLFLRNYCFVYVIFGVLLYG